MTTRIAVCGAAGRMGKTIIEACSEMENINFSAAIEHSGSPCLGMDSGELSGIGTNEVKIVSDILDVLDDFDVLIDFTLPDATLSNSAQCVSSQKAMVIGTTGLNNEQKQTIQLASESIGIVFAPNMSIGVNLCFKLAELAAEIIGEQSDIEIIEAHHRMKKDSPSGTAVRLGEIIADTLGRNLNECAVYGREGITGERDSKTIGFETIRAGDIVGDHTVMFGMQGERVEITHKATNRRNFASGALLAADWITEKKSGLFDMQDVLGLR